MRKNVHLWFMAALLAVAVGCSGPAGTGESGSGLQGVVEGDGSSTVYPISEAIAEEFLAVQPRVRVTVGVSGTGGGFKKFTIGETDFSNASRPIAASEIEAAAANGVEYVELPIAYDGLSVLVNPQNDFVNTLTVAELKQLWEPDSGITRWSDLRAGWPEREIHFYGPGPDSGTFDYFTEAIMGSTGAIRTDYSASENDNVLVQGISGDRDGIGFFGFAYYAENMDKLKVVGVDGGDGPITPSVESIGDGSYSPLSRPIFVYVNIASGERPEVAAYVKFLFENVKTLAEEVGYVGLPETLYELIRQRYDRKVPGSLYEGKTHEETRDLAALLESAE